MKLVTKARETNLMCVRQRWEKTRPVVKESGRRKVLFKGLRCRDGVAAESGD